MKLLLLFVLISVEATFALEDWNIFKANYGKLYTNPIEESFRKSIFIENLKLIEEHNKKYEQGLTTFSVKVNKYSDRTNEEIFPTSKRTNQHVFNAKNKKSSSKFTPRVEVPEAIDWREYGVISPVADQKFCESCWAFAVVGTVEAHMGIYRNTTVSLSQQNLVDCVEENFTCSQDLERNMLEKTYQYIIDNGGIDTAESYPYESYSVGTCRFTSNNVGGTIVSYANITEGDEEKLKAVVGTVGPVTVVVTTGLYWNSYSSGVYYKEDCMNVTLPFNHAVVVVGYGSENGQDYWLVKNSWGTWFGQQGYIKMARNRENNCGIASIGRYPIM